MAREVAERDASAVLRDASETLETAAWGLADLRGADPRRRLPGLRNVVVFGRAVTNVLQNLRTPVGKATFNEWYEPQQQKMREDDLLRYFYLLRTEILKEGTVQTGLALHITKLAGKDLAPLMQHPPPGAKGFFVGDQVGGSGWEVELPDGTVAKYYVALPDAIQANIKTSLHFQDPPKTHRGEPLADTSVEALAAHYVAYLRQLLREAHARFGH